MSEIAYAKGINYSLSDGLPRIYTLKPHFMADLKIFSKNGTKECFNSDILNEFESTRGKVDVQLETENLNLN